MESFRPSGRELVKAVFTGMGGVLYLARSYACF